MGSPNGSLLDLEGVGGHPKSTMDEKIEAMLTKRFAQFEVHFAALASILMLVKGFSRFEYTISGIHYASSGSGSARSWNVLGQSEAPQPLGLWVI